MAKYLKLVLYAVSDTSQTPQRFPQRSRISRANPVNSLPWCSLGTTASDYKQRLFLDNEIGSEGERIFFVMHIWIVGAFYNKQNMKVIRDFCYFFVSFFFHFKKRRQKKGKSESEWGRCKEMKNEIKSLLAEGRRLHRHPHTERVRVSLCDCDAGPSPSGLRLLGC